jgi:hypothetical protein
VPCCSQISEGYLTCTPGVKQAATDRCNTSTRNWGTLIPLHPATGCENANTRDRGRRCRSSQKPYCNGRDRVKGTRERRLTRGRMDAVRKADDDLSSGIMFSSTVGDAMQRVVPCLSWCASRGQPKSTASNARTGQVTSSTGKRSAGKLARCVWTGGKSVSSYLSVRNSL